MHPQGSRRGAPRFVVVAPQLPSPARNGDALRALHLVHALADVGPTAVFGLSRGGPPPREDLLDWTATSDANLTQARGDGTAWEWMRGTGSPFNARFSAIAVGELRTKVRELHADVVVVMRTEQARYVHSVRDLGVHVVLDADFVMSEGMREMAAVDGHRGRSALWRAAAARVAVLEDEVFGAVDQVWVSNSGESQRLSRRTTTDCAVVPSGVDVDTYPKARRSDANALVFPGRFDYWPNADAVRTLVDEVLPRLPDATLTCVGMSPPPWLREVPDPRVVVTGAVDDVRPYLAAAAAMPVPLKAAMGTRLKVIEAWAAGVPVVATGLGVAGLDAVDGEHFLRAESPEELCAGLDRLSREPRLAARLTDAASELARRRFSRAAVRQAVRGAVERLPASSAS
jgi:glycosyltransferase involved in cell wall biosynthesis